MPQFAANIKLSSLNGSNGFQISGEATDDFSGNSVSSAGDVNGDGFDDLIIGASSADPNGLFSGASYVVFGKATGFAANINLSSLDGTNGFQISGEAAGDQSGRSVSSAGDVNGDGFDDLIIGAFGADPNGSNSGASYVVFGKATGFAANINLSSLDGTDGFQISGEAANDASGISVSSAGDVNGDGFDDLIVGAYEADPNGARSGASYVVFGHRALTAVTIIGTDIAQTSNGGHGADTILGNGGGDRLFGWERDDSIDGGGGRDVLSGGSGHDTLRGGGGDDVLTGDQGDDNVVGGVGDDLLVGGIGSDRLRGGSGEDVFVFTSVSHSVPGSDRDRISDFADGDLIDVSAIDAVAGGSDEAFLFGGVTATAHGVWYELSATGATLFADTDGITATVELAILLKEVSSLSGDDLVL